MFELVNAEKVNYPIAIHCSVLSVSRSGFSAWQECPAPARTKKRVARLIREDGIRARQKRRFRRTTDSNHTGPIAPNVLQRDFERGPKPGLVHHSDRDSPYTSDDYRRALEARGLVASMSSTGDCWDMPHSRSVPAPRERARWAQPPPRRL